MADTRGQTCRELLHENRGMQGRNSKIRAKRAYWYCLVLLYYHLCRWDNRLECSCWSEPFGLGRQENEMNMLCWRKIGLECEHERSQETEVGSCGLQGLWQGDMTERSCEGGTSSRIRKRKAREFRIQNRAWMQIYDKGVGACSGPLAHGFGGHLDALLFAIGIENPK